MKDRLAKRIGDREVVVGVLGMGYVGLPLAHAFVEAGVRVVGFDTDPAKVEALNRGETYLRHLGESLVRSMRETGRFEAASDFARLGEVDAVLLCVPTPLDPHLQPDLSFVERSSEAVAAALRPGQLVVLESTTWPGTTREVVLPRLAARGVEVFVAYSPEREDPGRAVSTRSVPKLVGGLDDAAGDLAEALYALAFEEVVRVSSAEVAEAAKLLENVYRAVNIALVNEMKTVLTEMGVDVWEVIGAASTKPFGFQPFYPGPGLGGHCIPIDPFYLTWRAREFGQDTRFIELAGQINHAMPRYVVNRTAWALNEHGKAVRGARVLVLGLAYKRDVDDCRESPSFEIIEMLRELGARVEYNDPLIPEAPRVRRHDLGMRSVSVAPEDVARYDAVIVVTDHSSYEWETIVPAARLLIDTRNVTGALRPRPPNVVMA